MPVPSLGVQVNSSPSCIAQPQITWNPPPPPLECISGRQWEGKGATNEAEKPKVWLGPEGIAFFNTQIYISSQKDGCELGSSNTEKYS